MGVENISVRRGEIDCEVRLLDVRRPWTNLYGIEKAGEVSECYTVHGRFDEAVSASLVKTILCWGR